MLELAGAFLSDGINERPQVDGEQGDVDVSLEVFFGYGYTLDQISSTLDTLDVALTAGFIAAEARETGQSPGQLLERLTSAADPLDILWRVEYTEVGSLRIRVIVERVGNWASRYQTPTIWLLGGVGAFIPLFGLPVWAGVAAWAATGAVQGIAYVNDRRLSKKQTQGPKVSAAPPPQIVLGTVPTG